MKLSKRLQQLNQMAGSGYSQIWDCCCDHGYLGRALLERGAAQHVRFVDIAPHLIEQLGSELEQDFPEGNWQADCMDVAQLPLSTGEGKQLVIIAGIGGDLMAGLVNELTERNPDLAFDLLLCPVRHQFQVRKALRRADFRLTDEVLLEDNKRFYEILHAASPASATWEQRQISPVGEHFWQQGCSLAKAYLEASLNHYRLAMRSGRADDQQAFSAYQAIRL